MSTLKLHAKLKWATIIDRLNKEADFEKFVIMNDAIFLKGGAISAIELSEEPVYEERENPVFPALIDNVCVGTKVRAKKVYDKNSLLFIANTACNKELFIHEHE